ncbi:hypothetical protein quinque_005649 [Culex quinquefasciatus]|uniref:transcription factor HES-4-B n=1 Tax=Culex quinquefasciatus TaxID=7176 RepID=UPI0018E2BADD|nr:transcription factor HES-4-B [Culex quinquefasciatus]
MDNLRRSDHHDGAGGGDRDAESYLRRIKAEIRKTNKPIMEKKRRARINNYLNDLKALLLDAMKKDPIRHSKLEKADILDLTVKHLQDMERRKLAVAMAVDPTVVDKFKSGYNECVDEIDKYFSTVPGMDSGLKQRVTNHLKSYLKYQRFPTPIAAGAAGTFGGLFGRASDEINNNGRLAMEGLSLIPSLLPSGELAFIMPHGSAAGLPFLPRLSTAGGPTGMPPLGGSNHFKPIPHEKQPYAPSPPLSPVSDQDSVKGATSVDLRTPQNKGTLPTTMLKTRPALMESLLSAFPTPPTPEESSRISAFRPNLKLIDRIRMHQEGAAKRVAPDDRDEERECKRSRRVDPEEEDDDDDFSEDGDDEREEENDSKENSTGDMWRPW